MPDFILLSEGTTWGEYGLVGLMVGGLYAAIAWAGMQLLGRGGILRSNTKAIEAVAECVRTHQEAATVHDTSCKAANSRVSRLHHAARTAIDEIEAECKFHGLDVSERCSRVRKELGEDGT